MERTACGGERMTDEELALLDIELERERARIARNLLLYFGGNK